MVTFLSHHSTQTLVTLIKLNDIYPQDKLAKKTNKYISLSHQLSKMKLKIRLTSKPSSKLYDKEDEEDKEILLKSGKTASDPIEVANSITSNQEPTPPNLKQEHFTLENFPSNYGMEWLKEEMESVDMFPSVDEVTHSNISLLILNKATLNHNGTRFSQIGNEYFKNVFALWKLGW